MGIIGKCWKLGSMFLICLGIILLFVPAVGMIIGSLLFIIGVIMAKTKSKEHTEEKGDYGHSNLLFRIKPIIKSKKILILLIFLSFALFVIGPASAKLIFAVSLIFFFTTYINLKHAEDVNLKKHLEKHFSQQFGERLYGSGFISIIGGFLWMWFCNYISANMLSEPMSFIFRIGSIFVVLAFALPGLVFLIIGFLLIKYSYRYSDSHSDKRFSFVNPGSVVISKDSTYFKQ